MSTETIRPAPPEAKVQWRRAEFVLTALGFAGFITLPIRISTIYGGLPAHPLLLHIPVMLIPITAACAIACALRPSWFPRYGIALSLVSIVAMSSIFLTMRAGSALQSELGLGGNPIISHHSRDAKILAIVYILFTACAIVTFACARISGGMPTGLRPLDSLLGRKPALNALRALIALLALASIFWVFKTGDLGAKAVWQARLHPGLAAAGAGGPPNITGPRGG